MSHLIPPAWGGEVCSDLEKAWEKIETYQCTYQALIKYRGKQSETLMRYYFLKPNKIRMEINKPKKGVVLIYNPEISHKVRIRPFQKLPFFIIDYELKDPKVSSESGATVDRSDLGSRMLSLCQTLSEAEQSRAKNGAEEFKANGQGLREITLTEPGPANEKNLRKRFIFGNNNFLSKIETLNENGEIVEYFEWSNLELNPALDRQLFTKF